MRASGPGQSARLLLDVIDVLEREHIDYAVIGALAAAGKERKARQEPSCTSVAILLRNAMAYRRCQ